MHSPDTGRTGGEADRVQRVLRDGHKDGVLVIAQQQAHHGVHSLAGAVSQIQEVWVAREAISLLDALQQRSHSLTGACQDDITFAAQGQAHQCVQLLASSAIYRQQC